MGTMKLLSELREKPSHVKTHYAIFGAALVTLGIAAIWSTTLPARFSAISTSFEDVDTSQFANMKGDINALTNTGEDGEEAQSADIPGTAAFDTDNIPPPQSNEASALGSLEGWDVPATSSPARTPTVPVEEKPTVKADSVIAPTSTPPKVAPKPTVIRIGTTTKKSQ